MIKRHYYLICTFLILLASFAHAADISSCQTLSDPNSVNTLIGDIIQPLNKPCINITARNITLDCKGHSITTTQDWGVAGVYSNSPFTTIKNCNISLGKYWIGIELVSANHSFIFNNTLNNQGYGMFLTNVNHVTLELNTADYNGWDGFQFYRTLDGTSTHNTLVGNTANHNYAGIWMNNNLDYSNHTLIQNTASNNRYIGIWFGGGSNNNLDRNTADKIYPKVFTFHPVLKQEKVCIKNLLKLIFLPNTIDFIIILFLGLFIALLGLLTPIFTELIIDKGIVYSNVSFVLQLTIALIIVGIAITLFSLIKSLAIMRFCTTGRRRSR